MCFSINPELVRMNRLGNDRLLLTDIIDRLYSIDYWMQIDYRCGFNRLELIAYRNKIHGLYKP